MDAVFIISSRTPRQKHPMLWLLTGNILQKGVEPIHPGIRARCLVMHEVAQSTVSRGWSERSGWNTTGVDPLHLSLVLYELVEEIRVPKVILR
jgi:hypothetical protein